MRHDNWCRGMAPIVVRVPCNGDEHRVVWRSGRLGLRDHDLAAELALVALGADACPCIALLQRWRQVLADPGLDALSELADWRRRPWLARSGLPWLSKELAVMAGLALVIRTERRWGSPTFPRAAKHHVLSLLTARVTEAVEASLAPIRVSRPRLDVGVTCRAVGRYDRPRVDLSTGHAAVRVVAQLPAAWLVDVWARGVAVVDDVLVLGVQPGTTWWQLTVVGMRWELRGLYGVSLQSTAARVSRQPDGCWRLEHGDARSTDRRRRASGLREQTDDERVGAGVSADGRAQ